MITDVTSFVHHKFPVSFLLYIATETTCLSKQINIENSSMNVPIIPRLHKKVTLARFACLCVVVKTIVDEHFFRVYIPSPKHSGAGKILSYANFRLRLGFA